MVSNSAGDTVLSMEGDADPFFMRGSASNSLHGRASCSCRRFGRGKIVNPLTSVREGGSIVSTPPFDEF